MTVERDALRCDVPEQLRLLPKWLVWRYEQRGDDPKPTKVPYQVNGRKASTTDPATWTTFDDALSSCGRFDGLGFVFDGTGVTGIDLDHCREPVTGAIAPWAASILRLLDSYTEQSPSGTGVHVIVNATIPGKGRKSRIEAPEAHPNAAVEVYDRGRYFTVTGQRLAEYPDAVQERSRQVAVLYAQMSKDEAAPAPVQRTTPPPPIDLTDAALVEKAKAAKNGDAFSRLWRGDTSGHGDDDSAADLALCDHLAFWCGPDAARIDRLFRQSGLYREKWDREDYRDRTIGKALASVSDHYGSNRRSESPETAPRELHLTDLGNSERLVRDHGKNLRYVATWNRWIVYDERTGVWQRDETGEIARRMKDVVIAEHALALKEPDAEDRAVRVKHALKSESEPAIRHAIALASTHHAVAITHHGLDADPWKLVCANGVLDLRTLELVPHAREFLATKSSPVAFVENAPCPRFLQFLDEVFLKDKELIEFVQRAVGYSLTGDTREHAMFICHGSGSNGKTTLFRVLEHVLGDYAANSETSSFLARDRGASSGPRNDIARLVGARFVTAAEISEGGRLDEGLVKSLTGGDKMTARFLHQEFFEFLPQFKLWIATNHKPHIRGTDEGIWRRIRLIPFKAHFPRDKQDKNLVPALLAEAPGILAWAVNGCGAWASEGLPSVSAVDKAVEDYRAEQDGLGAWIEDCCERSDLAQTSNQLLYSNFVVWCEKNGEKPWTNKTFTMRLVERGFESRKTKNGKVWRGLRPVAEIASGSNGVQKGDG